MERDGTCNTDSYRSGAKEYKNPLGSDFMDLEKTFLESRTKKLGLCGAKQGCPGEEYIADTVPNIKKEKEAMMFQEQIE